MEVVVAIEDHPKFDEWSAALSRLTDAWENYTIAKAFGYTDDTQAKEAVVLQAMREFNKISDEIDA